MIVDGLQTKSPHKSCQTLIIAYGHQNLKHEYFLCFMHIHVYLNKKGFWSHMKELL